MYTMPLHNYSNYLFNRFQQIIKFIPADSSKSAMTMIFSYIFQTYINTIWHSQAFFIYLEWRDITMHIFWHTFLIKNPNKLFY